MSYREFVVVTEAGVHSLGLSCTANMDLHRHSGLSPVWMNVMMLVFCKTFVNHFIARVKSLLSAYFY